MMHPDFVRELLNTIADYNLAQIQEALKYDIDAVYFGDDWGQQRGLQMGPRLWRSFIYPELKADVCAASTRRANTCSSIPAATWTSSLMT